MARASGFSSRPAPTPRESCPRNRPSASDARGVVRAPARSRVPGPRTQRGSNESRRRSCVDAHSCDHPTAPVRHSQVLERFECGRIELPQHRPELVDLPLPGTDQVLMGTGQHLGCFGQVAVPGDRPMVMAIETCPHGAPLQRSRPRPATQRAQSWSYPPQTSQAAGPSMISFKTGTKPAPVGEILTRDTCSSWTYTS